MVLAPIKFKYNQSVTGILAVCQYDKTPLLSLRYNHSVELTIKIAKC